MNTVVKILFKAMNLTANSHKLLPFCKYSIRICSETFLCEQRNATKHEREYVTLASNTCFKAYLKAEAFKDLFRTLKCLIMNGYHGKQTKKFNVCTQTEC